MPVHVSPFWRSFSELAAAETEPLIAGQLVQAHRTARADLIRADADFGAHPEFATISKARRCVPIHGCGIDFVQELLRAVFVRSDDRVRVRRTVMIDVTDGFIHAAYGADVEDVIVVF